MLRFHTSAKAVNGGFLPEIKTRNARGQVIGSSVPKGAAREFQTFTTALHAEVEARCIALRVCLSLRMRGINIVVA